MEKHHQKVLAAAVKSLRWDSILEQLNEEYKIKGKPFAASKEKHTKESVKKELHGILSYMIESSIELVELDCWIVKWNTVFVSGTKQYNRLEIIFVPHRIVVREDALSDESESPEVITEDMLDNKEKHALDEILRKAEKDENFELCFSIHTRLKKLDKIIKRNENKKATAADIQKYEKHKKVL